MSNTPISVQLYSLREKLNEDFEGTIRKVAEIGYIGVEPYGGLPVPAQEAAKLFAELDLKVESSHLSVPIGDNKQKTLEDAAAYGLKTIVCPYQPREEFTTVDNVKRICETLNEAYANASAAGFQYGYHNHDFEFKQIGDQTGYDIMRAELDPNIQLQVDTYWVKVGGFDAAELVKDLGARSPLLHIKDGPGVRGQAMQAAGDGVMDIPAIVKAGEGTAQWLIVELDRCDTDMMEAIEKSYAYMTQNGLARGR